MSKDEKVIGIDLGTTNSEIAAMLDGQVQVLGPGERRILPSCVGLTTDDQLLVGEAARNQALLYPERTVSSIKRSMGSAEVVELGAQTFTPQEISALILRELAGWARGSLGRPPASAVITVPAYFSDAQRSATREAGELAGLRVARILNEPTAASLAYGYGGGRPNTVLIYDLGGGTFDASIVTVEGDVTEVLASHGNNRLGGDDFDALLQERLLEEFRRRHGIDLREGHPAALARLGRAAEEAKRRLSSEPYTMVREESLATASGKPLHLELELARDDYEELIRPMLESTLESVSTTLSEAGRPPADLDAVLLVGGSTRTPLVSELLEEQLGQRPRQDLHPDLCVALGAGILASRLAGEEVARVLVDVSPFSFGPSHRGMMDGRSYDHCYTPIINRNTPLPVTRTEPYQTGYPMQTEVEVEIYQGENRDALKNILVGQFRMEGLTPTYEPNLVLCRMSLDLDGILKVSAIEKATDKAAHITINNALESRSEEELAEARERLAALHGQRQEDPVGGGAARGEGDEPAAAVAPDESASGDRPPDPRWEQARGAAAALIERARGLLDSMHQEDREETIELNARAMEAMAAGDQTELEEATRAIEEMLFFIEGH